MSIDSRITTRLAALDEAPEPFLRALRDELPAEKPVRLLLHAPALSVTGVSAPAAVLVVIGDGWLVASENEAGDVSVDKCRGNLIRPPW